jgi:hypothetical protein
MQTLLTLCILAGAIGFAELPSALAQDIPRNHVQVPITAASPKDICSIEAIVKADYESISGGIGVPRQWSRDLSLYDPNARSFSVYSDPKTKGPAIWSPTFQEYADEANAHFVSQGFTERELAHKIYRFGNVATVLSSYEGTFASTGKVAYRGVNIYQLYYANKRWWISSVSWDGESNISPIPQELQPKP